MAASQAARGSRARLVVPMDRCEQAVPVRVQRRLLQPEVGYSIDSRRKPRPAVTALTAEAMLIARPGPAVLHCDESRPEIKLTPVDSEQFALAHPQSEGANPANPAELLRRGSSRSSLTNPTRSARSSLLQDGGVVSRLRGGESKVLGINLVLLAAAVAARSWGSSAGRDPCASRTSRHQFPGWCTVDPGCVRRLFRPPAEGGARCYGSSRHLTRRTKRWASGVTASVGLRPTLEAQHEFLWRPRYARTFSGT